MEKLGFIGLGAMGTPMARNLIAAGHHVTVYARRRDTMAPLLDAGAAPASSPAEVAAQSDVIHTMVIDTNAVEEVVLGTNGVIHGARRDSVVIDHSTISPAAVRRIAAQLKTRHVEMLDAPVTGGTAAAEARTLAMMVGGEEAAFERCRHVLSHLGQTIVYIGPSGAGQVAKACNQICLIVNQLGAAEAMLMADRCGVDPLRVKDAMMAGFAASRMLDLQAPKMVARNFEGKIESRLHHKDILIALEMARELGVALPASALAADLLTQLQERGGAKKDSAAIFTILESLVPKP